MRALSLSVSLQGELETETYEKNYNFVSSSQDYVVKSFPMLVFIDAFGLYRNMYRFILGWYSIPAALNVKDRNRRSNVFVLTLGPHGSSPNDIFAAVEPGSKALDRGMTMVINEQKTFVCASTHGFIGDMP